MKLYLEIVKSKLPTNKPRIDYLVKYLGWSYIKIDVFDIQSYYPLFIALCRSFFTRDLQILTRIPALPIPSLFLLLLLPNLSIEHHGIFESERNNSSIIRSLYSQLTLHLFRILCSKRCVYNICLSKEIAEHVVQVYNAPQQTIRLTVNSHDSTPHLLDRRSTDSFSLTFMCGKFYPWQGLDLCISLIEDLNRHIPVTLHLIGHLDSEQLQLINQFSYIINHGYLSNSEIDTILSETDVALAPLALDRQGLSESSSLKCAYYLSRGVSVLSYFKDTRFTSERFFFVTNPSQSQFLAQVIEFLHFSKSLSRQSVYSSSVDSWSHSSILNKLDLLFN